VVKVVWNNSGTLKYILNVLCGTYMYCVVKLVDLVVFLLLYYITYTVPYVKRGVCCIFLMSAQSCILMQFREFRFHSASAYSDPPKPSHR